MIEGFGIRLESALLLRSRSKQWLDDHAPLSRGATGRYISGQRGLRPSAEVIDRIAQALDVNATWLATGRGEPTDGTRTPVADRYPNRTVLYATAVFKAAHDDVQRWVAARSPREDLTLLQWRDALNSAERLHALGLLDVARGRRVHPSK